MKKSRSILLFILCLSGLEYACTSQNAATDTAVRIQVDVSQAKPFNYQDFYEIGRVIPLSGQSTEQFISEAHSVYLVDDTVVLFDPAESGKILLFDAKGNFVRRIGQRGRAEREYIELCDVDVDPQTKRIYAMDRITQKMFTYAMNGAILEIKPSKFCFNSFVKMPEGFWIYSCYAEANPQRYNLMYVSEDLQEMRQGYFPVQQFIETTFQSTFTKDEKGIPYFYYPYSNTIYQVSDSARAFLRADFGAKNPPFEALCQTKDAAYSAQLLNQEHYIGVLSNVVVLGRECMFRCRETPVGVPVKNFFVRYDGQTQTPYVYGEMALTEGMFNLPMFAPKGVTPQHEVIFALQPSSLFGNSIDLFNTQFGTQLRYDSNLVILLMKRK
ncbi:MAG: 6-bladed beta-propeller [Alistipes sp.]|nr:6-bladed beta-propeller [Alistipes sp.]